MSKISDEIGYAVVYMFNMIGTIAWIAGIVIAQGFTSTFFAVIFLPYAWYLVVERLLQVYGLI